MPRQFSIFADGEIFCDCHDSDNCHLSYFFTFENRNFRTFCQQNRIWFHFAQKSKFFAVSNAEINVNFCVFRIEYVSFLMLDFIFVGAIRTAFCVTPIMFEDKFAVRVFGGNTKIFAIGFRPKISESIFALFVPRFPGFIRFTVKSTGDNCDSAARNDFFDKTTSRRISFFVSRLT